MRYLNGNAPQTQSGIRPLISLMVELSGGLGGTAFAGGSMSLGVGSDARRFILLPVCTPAAMPPQQVALGDGILSLQPQGN